MRTNTGRSFTAGEQTWVTLPAAKEFVTGQKIDFTDVAGIEVLADGGPGKLEGTYLVAKVDAGLSRLRLMDVIERQPIRTQGEYRSANVATYYLVGPDYFYFFAGVMSV